MTNKESFCRIVLYACIYFFGVVLLIWLPVGLNDLAENLISGENNFIIKSKVSILIDGLLIYPLLYFFTIYLSLQYEKIRRHHISLLLWFFPAIFVCAVVGFYFSHPLVNKDKHYVMGCFSRLLS